MLVSLHGFALSLLCFVPLVFVSVFVLLVVFVVFLGFVLMFVIGLVLCCIVLVFVFVLCSNLLRKLCLQIQA